MLTPTTGYCTSCRQILWDHPDVGCPWCADGAVTVPAAELGADLERDPVTALLVAAKASSDELRAHRSRLRDLARVRSEAARRVIEAGRADEVLGGRLTMSRLEHWAEPAAARTCGLGHLRSTTGRWVGKHWECAACLAMHPKRGPKQRKPGDPLRQMHTYWERFTRERPDVRPVLPPRLLEPLPPPPGTPSSTSE